MRDRVLALALLVLAAACGGKISGGVGQGGGSSGSSSGGTSSGGSSSGGTNSCLETSGGSQACISCIESECGSQLTTTESGCSALISCECPGGIYSVTAANSCTSLGMEPSCMDTLPPLDACESQFCAGPCSGGGSSSGGTIPAGCTADDTIDCSGGAMGYACAIGDNPEAENVALSCSTPTTSGGEADYCCFYDGSWSPAACQPDDDLTSVCPDPDSYGYQCDAGDDPTSDDPQLNCSTSTPDADGVHGDFCCTYE